MAQNTPNASIDRRRSSSGYAAAFDGQLAQYSGVEYGGDAIVSPGDGNNGTSDSDTVFAFMDTSSSTATFTLQTADTTAGRVIHVVDVGGNANNNAITVATQDSETIDGSATASISSASGQVALVSDGTNWFTY